MNLNNINFKLARVKIVFHFSNHIQENKSMYVIYVFLKQAKQSLDPIENASHKAIYTD